MRVGMTNFGLGVGRGDVAGLSDERKEFSANTKQIPPPQDARERILRVGMTNFGLGVGRGDVAGVSDGRKELWTKMEERFHRGCGKKPGRFNRNDKFAIG